jgi:hypothetical protein
LAEALMVHGGRDLHLATERLRAEEHHAPVYIHLPLPPPSFPLGLDGPPPGHPERLCPEIPLTLQELLLLRGMG